MLSVSLLTLHLVGLAVGLGGATIGDLAVLGALLGVVTEAGLAHLRHLSYAIWGGLVVLASSGVGLLALHPSTYLHSSGFQAKMVVVAVLTLNGVLLHRRLARPLRITAATLLSGAVSTGSWYGALLIAMYKAQVRLALSVWLEGWAAGIMALWLAYAGAHRMLTRRAPTAVTCGPLPGSGEAGPTVPLADRSAQPG